MATAAGVRAGRISTIRADAIAEDGCVPSRQRHQRTSADVTPCWRAMLSTLRPRASSAIRASQNDLGRRIRATLHVASRPDYPSILGQLHEKPDGMSGAAQVSYLYSSS